MAHAFDIRRFSSFILPLDQLPRIRSFFRNLANTHLKLKICHDEMKSWKLSLYDPFFSQIMGKWEVYTLTKTANLVKFANCDFYISRQVYVKNANFVKFFFSSKEKTVFQCSYTLVGIAPIWIFAPNLANHIICFD